MTRTNVRMIDKEMADEFFNGDSPFPSRGVYGDGVAYAAPSYKENNVQSIRNR